MRHQQIAICSARLWGSERVQLQLHTLDAERLPHHSLDFVYLDARHDYDSVMSDLAEWHDRLRPGGVIAGHDYVDGDFVDGLFGVESAVNEFFGARGLRVRATFADPPWFSWWVQIPRA